MSDNLKGLLKEKCTNTGFEIDGGKVCRFYSSVW